MVINNFPMEICGLHTYHSQNSGEIYNEKEYEN